MAYSGISIAERDRYREIFASLAPTDGKLVGLQAGPVLMKSNLSQLQLEKIWNLADIDRDGALDIEEFMIAMRLTYDTINGSPIPSILSAYLIPPIKQPQKRSNPLAGVQGIPTLASIEATVGFCNDLASPLGTYGLDHAAGGTLKLPVLRQVRMSSISLLGCIFTALSTATSQQSRLRTTLIGISHLPYDLKAKRSSIASALMMNKLLKACRIQIPPIKPHLTMARLTTCSAKILGRVSSTRGILRYTSTTVNVVDLYNTDSLNKDQFVLFMHIVQMRRSNKPIPRAVPPEVIATFRLAQASSRRVVSNANITTTAPQSTASSMFPTRDIPLSRKSSFKDNNDIRKSETNLGDRLLLQSLEEELATLKVQGRPDTRSTTSKSDPSNEQLASTLSTCKSIEDLLRKETTWIESRLSDVRKTKVLCKETLQIANAAGGDHTNRTSLQANLESILGESEKRLEQARLELAKEKSTLI